MQRNKNLYIMCAIALLQGMVFYAPIATLYRQAAGLGIMEISIIESISMAVSIFMELPWGIVADRIGYKRSFVICCILYFISKIVFWRAEGFGAFLAERLILAVVISGLSGVDASIIYLSCKKGESQRAFALYDGFGTVGILAASMTYTVFLKGNYRLTAFCTMITYALAMVLAFFLDDVKKPETESKARGFFGTLKSVFTSAEVIFLVIAAALVAETNQYVSVWLAQVKYFSVGAGEAFVGVAHIAVTVAGLLGVFSARFTRKTGRIRGGIILICVMIFACGIMAIAKNAYLAAVMTSIVCVSGYLFAPLGSDLQNIAVKSDDRATSLSVNALLADGVAILTSVIFGALADENVNFALAMGAVCCALALPMFIVSAAKITRRTARP